MFPQTQADPLLIKDAAAVFSHGEKMQLAYNVRNTHRAIGTRLSSHLVRRFGMAGLQPGHVTVRLTGSAGCSPRARRGSASPCAIRWRTR